MSLVWFWGKLHLRFASRQSEGGFLSGLFAKEQLGYLRGSFGRLIDAASSGGRIVFFGATRGDAQLPVRKVFWRQITLLGTTMGSPSDWAAMNAFVVEKRIRPVVSEVFPLARAGDAFALMERGGQFGKIVVAMA